MAAIDLDKDQWQKLKAVLTEALKLASSERVEMLNRRLANDPTLRQRAIEMLRYYDRATKPFGATETQSETLGGPPARREEDRIAFPGGAQPRCRGTAVAGALCTIRPTDRINSPDRAPSGCLP